MRFVYKIELAVRAARIPLYTEKSELRIVFVIADLVADRKLRPIQNDQFNKLLILPSFLNLIYFFLLFLFKIKDFY